MSSQYEDGFHCLSIMDLIEGMIADNRHEVKKARPSFLAML